MKKIHFTEHSKIKMRQYGLSKSKLMGLIYRPERKELGIVDGTIAVMKTNRLFINSKLTEKKVFKKNPGEIWLMYLDTQIERKVISAWRYPGTTKPQEPLPIPNDIKEFINQNYKFKNT